MLKHRSIVYRYQPVLFYWCIIIVFINDLLMIFYYIIWFKSLYILSFFILLQLMRNVVLKTSFSNNENDYFYFMVLVLVYRSYCNNPGFNFQNKCFALLAQNFFSPFWNEQNIYSICSIYNTVKRLTSLQFCWAVINKSFISVELFNVKSFYSRWKGGSRSYIHSCVFFPHLRG